jgi:uncharacterized coiled-coil DUF342 family protein
MVLLAQGEDEESSDEDEDEESSDEDTDDMSTPDVVFSTMTTFIQRMGKAGLDDKVKVSYQMDEAYGIRSTNEKLKAFVEEIHSQVAELREHHRKLEESIDKLDVNQKEIDATGVEQLRKEAIRAGVVLAETQLDRSVQFVEELRPLSEELRPLLDEIDEMRKTVEQHTGTVDRLIKLFKELQHGNTGTNSVVLTELRNVDKSSKRIILDLQKCSRNVQQMLTQSHEVEKRWVPNQWVARSPIAWVGALLISVASLNGIVEPVRPYVESLLELFPPLNTLWAKIFASVAFLLFVEFIVTDVAKYRRANGRVTGLLPNAMSSVQSINRSASTLHNQILEGDHAAHEQLQEIQLSSGQINDEMNSMRNELACVNYSLSRCQNWSDLGRI